MGRLDLKPSTGRYEAGAVIEATVTAHDLDFDLTTLGFDGGELTVPGSTRSSASGFARASVPGTCRSRCKSRRGFPSSTSCAGRVTRNSRRSPALSSMSQVAVGEAC